MGDLIWHLPHLRTIAGASASGRVTLITKPSTQAESLLEEDPAIERIIWYEHHPRQGPDSRANRGRHDGPWGAARLIATLRAGRFQSCVLLHHSAALAAMLRLAGIGARYGYGYRPGQRFWLNRPPYLPEPAAFTEAFVQASAYTTALGLGALSEPALRVSTQGRATLAALGMPGPGPVVVLGVGAAGEVRQWGATRFALLAAELRARGAGTVLLLAATQEAALCDAIMAALPTGTQGVRPLLGWPLPAVMALLEQADLFIGNDSGLMNLRAALGRPAYALFGASGPLRHSALIRAVVPPGGARAGMDAISVAQVIAESEEALLF